MHPWHVQPAVSRAAALSVDVTDPKSPERPTPASFAGGRGDTWEEVRAVSLPLLIGLLVRTIPLVSAGFPLNDGGLFYAMAEDIRRAGFALPQYSSYNGIGIPFAYPPLAFYLAAALASLPGVSMTAVLMAVPLVASVLTIPAVYLLSRELLPSRFQALIAAYAFAVLPRAFEWMIDGGGLTRSPGFLFAVLGLWQAAVFYRSRTRQSAVMTSVLAGLTVLTHPQAALFGVVSVALFFVFLARDRRALVASMAMLAGALVVASPWWAMVLLRFGLGPLVSGGQAAVNARESFQYLVTWTFTDEPYMAFLAAVGLVGALYCVAHRRWLLPTWVVALFVIDPRGAPTYSMVSLSMLVAIGIRDVILAAVRTGPEDRQDMIWPRALVRDRFAALVLAATLVLGLIAGVKAPVTPYNPLHALSADNRAAMAWVSEHTPSDAQFAVVTGFGWWIDATAEWFPVLAARASVSTAQGWEWTGNRTWQLRVQRDTALQLCATSTAECLRAWAGSRRVGLYVYLPKGRLLETPAPGDDGEASLRASLREAPDARLIYDGPGATVFVLSGGG